MRAVARIASAFFLLAVAALPAFPSAPPAAETPRAARALSRERTTPPPPGTPLVAVLCYHDLSDDPGRNYYTIPPERFRTHLRHLRESGWTFLSLHELIARKERFDELPPKVAVVTFDDAYRSFFEKALPILREEGVRATLSVVTSFIDSPSADLPPLMTWEQIDAVARSGTVEIASHSHDLHRYETDNPYGDTSPSLSTRRYLLREHRYEDRDEYRSRIRSDLRKAKSYLSEKVGAEVKVLAWPFGEHNAMARELAVQEGFSVTLGLEGTDVRREDLDRGHLPRVMVTEDMDPGGNRLEWLYPRRPPVRAAFASIDNVYESDPHVLRGRVDRLVGKIRAAGANTVILQPLADPCGDGCYRGAYFMNHQVPLQADILSMVSHKFRHAGIRVYLRVPVMNLFWEWERHPRRRIVSRSKRGGASPAPWPFRLSPADPEARQAAVDFFTDIAVYLVFDGILIDGDAYLSETEDLLRNRPSTPGGKSAAIRKLVEEVKSAVLAWKPHTAFARILHAPAAMRDGVHPDVSQDFDRFLSDYDLTVVTVPAGTTRGGREAVVRIRGLARRLVRKADDRGLSTGGIAPVMLRFGGFDRAMREWVSPADLTSAVRAARGENVLHLGIDPVLPAEGELPAGILREGPYATDRKGSERNVNP